MNRYYDVIREAMNQLGHSEVVEDSSADIHFYNHIVNDEKSNNMIIVKPTAPTAKHFALDRCGYANTSEMAYEDPYVYEYMYSHLNPKNNMDWSKIDNLIANKSNKSAFFKAYPSHKQEIRDFIRSNGLLIKPNQDRDIKKLAMYCHQMKWE